jgi:cytochrome c oxidase cbb3-type subunit I
MTPATDSAKIDASCRLPLLALFGGAALWLGIGSIFALIASIKFHSPTFLADSAWLTYGRVHPAQATAWLYGFCIPAGLGVGLWLLARLGRCAVEHAWLAVVGPLFWNLGVALGLIGILAGHRTGFESLDLPGYAAPLLALGYLMLAVCGALTFHQRRERHLFVSQWFVFVALFWFAWIYSTAQLLLITFPVRGVTQPVIAWWFANNLEVVWLGLMGLAAAFYFVPWISRKDLQSRNLALLFFWTWILFASWGGIPLSAPTPAWIPVLSSVATVLTLIPLLAVAASLYLTVGLKIPDSGVPFRFIAFGLIAFLIAGLMRVANALAPVNQITNLSWFTTACQHLNAYGFFTFVLFGAIYFILPRVLGAEFPWRGLVRGHFWLAAAGVSLIVLPQALAGFVQGWKLQDPTIAFVEVQKATLPFLRVSTLGDLSLALGHLALLINLAGLAHRVYRPKANAACAALTADVLIPAEAKP